MGDFFAELRRRHIYRIGAGYVVVAWGIAQVIDFLSQVWALPAGIAQPVSIVLAIGLPVTLIAAWLIEGKAHEAVADTLRSPATTVILLIGTMTGIVPSFALSADAQEDSSALNERIEALFAAYPVEASGAQQGNRSIEPPPGWSAASISEYTDHNPNFAGRFYLGYKGCGTACQIWQVLNPGGAADETQLLSSSGALYRSDSRLIILNDPNETGWLEDEGLPDYLSPKCRVFDGAKFLETECAGLTR
jgi:hypothetical protein